MRNIVLLDTEARNHLYPLTATRPMGELRVGILTLREKWERRLEGTASYITEAYLQDKYPLQLTDDNLIVNGSIVPTVALCQRIGQLQMFEALLHEGELVAARLSRQALDRLLDEEDLQLLDGQQLTDIPLLRLQRLWHLNQFNAQVLAEDFDLLTHDRRSAPISPTNQVLGANKVFLEPGAKMECCILNATQGPIYIGANAEVMEGSMLRGPIALGEGAIVKMGAKIYGPTTIGPGCRVGGEVTRSILLSNSNKGHEGYLGDSVLGEWCNLGADTNNSNLKNNYAEVKLWNYVEERFVPTGLQFFGLVMGDHSKSGINTMFNTGTVVGVSANVFGSGFVRNFVPDFSWGGPDTAYRTYRTAEAFGTIQRVQERRNVAFTEADRAILEHIFLQTAQFRSWEKEHVANK